LNFQRGDGLLDCEELGTSLKSIYPNSFSSDIEKFFMSISTDGLEIKKKDFDQFTDKFSEKLKNLGINAEELSLRFGIFFFYMFKLELIFRIFGICSKNTNSSLSFWDLFQM
jgi:Ca2+-binding EF-hand superfamily protein